MKHKRLAKIILPFTLCIAIALGNITIVRAEQDLSGESNVNSQQSKQTDRTNQTDQTDQTDQKESTVIINGEEVPLSEGENITKNDNTGLLCVGLFAGVLVLAGAREFKIRKHIK